MTTNIGITASYFVLWFLVLLLSTVVYVLARHVGMLHIRVGNTGARMTNVGPDIGSIMPALSTRTLNDRQLTIGGSSRSYTLLVFIAPGCFNCSQLAPAFKAIARFEKDVTFCLIGRGEEEKNREYLQEHHISDVLAVCSNEIHALYAITGTPYAVLLDRNGAVMTKGIVNTAVHLESILNVITTGYSSASDPVLANNTAHGLSSAS